MERLYALRAALRRASAPAEEYRIPARWNTCGASSVPAPGHPGEILVDPAEFYARSIDGILSRPETPLSRPEESVIYAMLPRALAAWDHTGVHQDGTWLKCIALLPGIRALGVNMIYLLPMFVPSAVFLKGDAPSPYAIRDAGKVDPALADPLLPGLTADEQFGAFVEACHHLGMRVMMDFVFRTAARDSVYLKEHPDWFYWVKASAADSLTPPGVEGIGHSVVTPALAPRLYASAQAEKFLSAFVFPPSGGEWETVCREAARTGEPLPLVSIRLLGICPAPGFADTINDPQPPWSDVTFLRFYFDPTPAAVKTLPDAQTRPPFIAPDGIKCSVFPGQQPNEALWARIREIIPGWIRAFGVDGARIDMAHALPEPLARDIVRRVKEEKPDFLLWSEEFDPANSGAAKSAGYRMMSGDLWTRFAASLPESLASDLLESIQSELPVTAAAELPDSPRAPRLTGGREAAEGAVTLLSLLPNTVLMFTCGQELGELQPMNLGLLTEENGAFVLPPDDPMYGRLAFFDPVRFHWTSPGGCAGTLRKAAQLRAKFRPEKKKIHLENALPDGGALALDLPAGEDTPGASALFSRKNEQLSLPVPENAGVVCAAARAEIQQDTVHLGPFGYIVWETETAAFRG